MPEQNEWYTNKDLFELIGNMQQEFHGLRSEMRETRTLMKQYNGLREEIGVVKDRVDAIEAKEEGRNSVGLAIRNWSGWIFGFITLIVLLIKFWGGV
ncbi:hypothetical protein JOC34_000815 [Virgibacillus halotolerans]|uniref:hypothetical protein n=1 Tax=Virgibacillus halotolerans TaxID=1071053 RepID=UPI0019614B18|nr:hypothetical protein [Virgibacillus halotolerans]MBM7598458.1 hypothetical protein [Virgibacillus halotolerans]